jgi:hypothetical protein
MKHNHNRPFELQDNDKIVTITVPNVDIGELRRQQYRLLVSHPSPEFVGLINLIDYMLDVGEKCKS